MCQFCSNREIIKNEEIAENEYLKTYALLKLDIDTNVLYLHYGAACKNDTTIIKCSYPLEINICPCCGKILPAIERDRRVMAIGYDCDMEEYGIIIGVANSDDERKAIEARSTYDMIDWIDLLEYKQLGDRYYFDGRE